MRVMVYGEEKANGLEKKKGKNKNSMSEKPLQSV
jgi:hypothetical protein